MRHVTLSLARGDAEFTGRRVADWEGVMSCYVAEGGRVVVYDPYRGQLQEFSPAEFAAAFSFAPGIVAELAAGLDDCDSVLDT
jgi:hypothetical protein